MPADGVSVETTVVGAVVSTVAAAATWALTARRKDKAQATDYISAASEAIVTSAMALVAQHEGDVHECQKALAEVRAELATLRTEVAALRGV